MKVLPKIEVLELMAQDNGKGFTRAALASWGVPWPPPKGWLKALKREIKTGLATEIRPAVKAPPKSTYSPNPNKTLKSFYASWEWRTLRMEVLKAFGHRCQSCGATTADITVSGKPVRLIVDHIKPVSKFWELRLDRDNLQVLCDECNMGKGAWDETDYRQGEINGQDRQGSD